MMDFFDLDVTTKTGTGVLLPSLNVYCIFFVLELTYLHLEIDCKLWTICIRNANSEEKLYFLSFFLKKGMKSLSLRVDLFGVEEVWSHTRGFEHGTKIFICLYSLKIVYSFSDIEHCYYYYSWLLLFPTMWSQNFELWQ